MPPPVSLVSEWTYETRLETMYNLVHLVTRTCDVIRSCAASRSLPLTYLAINNDVLTPNRSRPKALDYTGDDVQLTRGYFRRERKGVAWLPGQVDDEIDVRSEKFLFFSDLKKKKASPFAIVPSDK